MNRFTSCVPAALVLSAWSVATLAADETSSAAAPAVATTAASATTSSAPTKTNATTSSANDGTARYVCLDLSHRCFAVKPKSSDEHAQAQAASLQLKPPDIRSVAQEWQLRPTDDSVQVEEQQVQVEGSRPDVYVPLGLASLPWAVMHPTQAWRLFVPVPPGTAK